MIMICLLLESINRSSMAFICSRSLASGVPATTFSAVPMKSKLLAFLWCTFNADKSDLMCCVSVSSNFCMCDWGNDAVNLLVSSSIYE
ncbi:hypothetical protein KR044_008642, partial [Drosophila immigrans]